jgi:glycosyltransferase involved in cell wall biosynthesis
VRATRARARTTPEMYEHAILIPAYNGQAYIAETLECALAQTGIGIQILVSDDASTDGTAAILARYASSPRIKVMMQPRNIGLFPNWNFLLRANTAPTFTLISQDDVFASNNAVARAVEILREDASCPAVFCDLQLLNEEGALLSTRQSARGHRFDAHEWGRRSVLQCRNLFGIPLAVRASAAHGLLFDESLAYVADLAFAIAVSSKGLPAHMSEPLLQYRVHGGNASIERQNQVLSEMAALAAANNYCLSSFESVKQQFFALATVFGRSLLFRSRMARIAVSWYSKGITSLSHKGKSSGA